jgi:hypothetical protein
MGRNQLSLDNRVTDSIPDEVTERVEIELAHDIGSVRFHGLDGNIQRDSYLITLSFREQLDNFALPGSQGPTDRSEFLLSDAPIQIASKTISATWDVKKGSYCNRDSTAATKSRPASDFNT